MRTFLFCFLSLFLFLVGCKSSSTSTIAGANSSAKSLLEAVHLEIEKMAEFTLKTNIERRRTSIPINDQQAAFLETHTRFKNIVSQNQKEFTNWLQQQKTLSKKEQQETIVCLQQAPPLPTNCSQNNLLIRLNEVVLPKVIHDVSNYSVQFLGRVNKSLE
ncbi:MAG: hypothetical protein ACRBFS_05745 [Aureispira sp.]